MIIMKIGKEIEGKTRIGVISIKIIKDNSKNNQLKIEDEIRKFPIKAICEYCESELECEESDISIGEYGCAYFHCPICGKDSFIDNEDIDLKLTIENLKFPAHFHHTCVENRAVDNLNNETVKKFVRDAIAFFRKHKDEFAWVSTTGTTSVYVYRLTGDEAYEVHVSGDHYETMIPFEPIDY